MCLAVAALLVSAGLLLAAVPVTSPVAADAPCPYARLIIIPTDG